MTTLDKTYAVTEIFRSIQGEGFHAGQLAVFVRFAGCNLACPWCDTDHSIKRTMTGREIVEKVSYLLPKHVPFERLGSRLVVLTGGEPLLQVDSPLGLALYREAGASMVAIETNGTLEPPAWRHWLTVSPKKDHPIHPTIIPDEIKLVADPAWVTAGAMMKLEDDYPRISRLYLQPLDGPVGMNVPYCLDLLRMRPAWRLSAQMHKLLGLR